MREMGTCSQKREESTRIIVQNERDCSSLSKKFQIAAKREAARRLGPVCHTQPAVRLDSLQIDLVSIAVANG